MRKRWCDCIARYVSSRGARVINVCSVRLTVQLTLDKASYFNNKARK